MSQLRDELESLVVSLRRGENVDSSWAALNSLVTENAQIICEMLDTRWLISLCDTYADFGNEIERRNATMVAMLVKLEKVYSTYVAWRVDYHQPLVPPHPPRPDRFALWDGVRSMDMDLGDATNTLFSRIEDAMSATPHLEEIYKTVINRMQNGPTILSTMNQYHGHIFDTDIKWRDAPKYEKWRESGRLKPRSKVRIKRRPLDPLY